MRNPTSLPAKILIAIGGNAIHPGHIRGTVAEQIDLAASTARSLLPIMQLDNELVITHGNGPVVGKILMRQAIARDQVAPMSLDICVAHSQGGIAYLLMQALENALRRAGNARRVVCMLTEVEVDRDDPDFDAPSKPIGYFFDEAQARAVGAALGWEMREDSGRGWRHVVPSPEPRRIIDASLIGTLAQSGAVVIAAGGGGIPVVREADGTRRGVEAVVDKDLSSARLAGALGSDVLLILTAVSKVSIHFGTERQEDLSEVRMSKLKQYQRDGHFAAGSMGPKVEAAIRFVGGGGQRAVIAHLDHALDALRGNAGTQILPDAA